MKDFWQPEELVIGGVWGLSVGLCIGLIPTIQVIACAVLWRLGGMGFMGTKVWRRLGVPMTLSMASLFVGHKLSLLGLLAFAPLTIGYGIPENDDNPSPLGTFFWNITKQNPWWTNILTRGTCHLLTAICLIPTWL